MINTEQLAPLDEKSPLDEKLTADEQARQQQMQRVMDEADLLIAPVQVELALQKLAEKISQEVRDEMPVIFSIMNGALVFSGKLMTYLDFPLEQGYMHATRYRGEIRGSRELQWQALPSVPMDNRTVVILDDIFDEGYTLSEVVEACKAQGAKRVLTAVLLNKQHDRKVKNFAVDFVGLEVEDRYVFGYGMDYLGFWRNANGIYAVKDL